MDLDCKSLQEYSHNTSVHQGFILGPMLFLIYADDLICNMTIYADDIHSTLSVITLKCLNLNLI